MAFLVAKTFPLPADFYVVVMAMAAGSMNNAR